MSYVVQCDFMSLPLLCSPKHAEVQGLKFKPGNAVITSVKDPTDLRFARIEELFIVNSNVVLGLQTLNVVEYCNHYHSWIEVSPVLLTLQIKDIQSRQFLFFVLFEDLFGNIFI